MTVLILCKLYPDMVYACLSDINKFLWMVRIGGSTEKGRHINEMDYYTPQGEFRVDREGSPTLLNCLMYKMCYYRFGAVYTESGKFCTFYSLEKIILITYTECYHYSEHLLDDS